MASSTFYAGNDQAAKVNTGECGHGFSHYSPTSLDTSSGSTLDDETLIAIIALDSVGIVALFLLSVMHQGWINHCASQGLDSLHSQTQCTCC